MAKKTQPEPEPEDVEEGLVLDLRSFTSPERLECQVYFDAPFGDLAKALYEAIDPGRSGPSEMRIDGPDGRVFPDQIAQFMLWVQAKRDDPDVDLEAFDGLSYGELNGAFTRGLVGKASKSTRSTSSSPEPDSADSSPG